MDGRKGKLNMEREDFELLRAQHLALAAVANALGQFQRQGEAIHRLLIAHHQAIVALGRELGAVLPEPAAEASRTAMEGAAREIAELERLYGPAATGEGDRPETK
jgi:hypothetical protein